MNVFVNFEQFKEDYEEFRNCLTRKITKKENHYGSSNYLDRIDYYICSGGDHHGSVDCSDVPAVTDQLDIAQAADVTHTSRTVKRVKDSGKGGKGVSARLDHFTHDIDLDREPAYRCFSKRLVWTRQ